MVDRLRVTLCFLLGGKDEATSEEHQQESLALSKMPKRLWGFPDRSLTVTLSARLTTISASLLSLSLVTLDLSIVGLM